MTGAIIDTFISLSPLTQLAANKQTLPAFTPTPAKANSEPLDVDNASVQELWDALKLCNFQYHELTSFGTTTSPLLLFMDVGTISSSIHPLDELAPLSISSNEQGNRWWIGCSPQGRVVYRYPICFE